MPYDPQYSCLEYFKCRNEVDVRLFWIDFVIFAQIKRLI
jgi:hypothetical protein